MAKFLHTKIESGERLVATDITDLTFFPKGTILMFSSEAWSATSAAFKNIWKICNGQGGTPNLVNKFLRGGTSSDFTSGGGGDSQSVTLSARHMPKHNHTFSNGTTNSTNKELVGTWHGVDNVAPYNVEGSGIVCLRNDNHTRGGITGWDYNNDRYEIDARHSHGITGNIGESGGGSAASGYGEPFTINTLPSYYTVIYIIKVA
jgi:hypothetical protein